MPVVLPYFSRTSKGGPKTPSKNNKRGRVGK